MRTLILLLLTVLALASTAVAQSKKDKIEIGVQTTSLTLFHQEFAFDETEGGFGGRVTYNFNRSIAAEAEINFFPKKLSILGADGSGIQAQFGAKVGKRFEKWGLFAKVRPGFLSVDSVGSILPGGVQTGGTLLFKIERETFFTLDMGGVLELYPSRRMVVRFDAGDTVLRHHDRFAEIFTTPGPPSLVLISPAKFKHNFQFTAGVGFRLGDFPDEGPDVNTSTERSKRFEVGTQFTSLFLKPSNIAGVAASALGSHNEPGFGGRFTFNLTDNIAFEAEGNYFTRRLFSGPQEGGHMFQGQFGGKVGKRFDRWGVFGKARPGFIGFTRVVEFPFGVPTPPQPGFELVRKYHPSLDLGGVVEFYISPRWMARFDVGDTIVRYKEIRFPTTPPLFTVPAATRNNLQVSSGIGFRF